MASLRPFCGKTTVVKSYDAPALLPWPAPCSLRSVSPVGSWREALSVPRRFLPRLQTGEGWSSLQSSGETDVVPFQDLCPPGEYEGVGFVLHCRVLQPLCGEEIRNSPHTSRGSRFSAYLWGIQILCNGSWRARLQSTVSCWRESLKFQTRSRRGYCCPSAQPLGQTSS